jgi:ribosomal protein S18 acetylase RimI-like enzyme
MTALERASITVSIAVTLRIATQSDIPKLEWYGQYTHHRNLFWRAYREQQLGRRLILVADSNNFPIGHIFIQFIGQDYGIADGNKRAYLYSLRVMEMFRGYGIGTCLIQEAESHIQDRGFEWITIAVGKSNHQARRLYERLDYHTFAEDPGHWSYIDHEGRTRNIHEPCWLLQKQIHVR